MLGLNNGAVVWAWLLVGLLPMVVGMLLLARSARRNITSIRLRMRENLANQEQTGVIADLFRA